MTDKPKRPMSAYFIFLKSARTEILAEHFSAYLCHFSGSKAGLRATEVAKIGGEMWRSMQDKSEWEQKAAIAKEQYAKDLESFNANGGSMGGDGSNIRHFRPVATHAATKRTRKGKAEPTRKKARNELGEEDDAEEDESEEGEFE